MAEFQAIIRTEKLTYYLTKAYARPRSVLFDRGLNLATVARRVNGKMVVNLTGQRPYALSAKTENCINNGKAGKLRLSQITIKNKDFETFTTYCTQEIEAKYCGSETQTTIAEAVSDPIGSTLRSKIGSFFWALTLKSLVDRIVDEVQYGAMFGDTSFVAGSNAQGRRNGVATTDTNYPFFEKFIATQDGVWTDMLNSSLSTDPDKTAYFDTNDGNAGNNILNPNNVIERLTGFVSLFSPEMQSNPDMVVIMADPAILQSLNAAYIAGVAGSTLIGVDKQENFNPMVSTIRFMGYTIRPFVESYLYGREAKTLVNSNVPNLGPIKHEKNCRMFASMIMNMGVTTSGQDLPSQENVALLARPSTNDRELGVINIMGNVNMGSGVLEFIQTVIGYASSTNFAV